MLNATAVMRNGAVWPKTIIDTGTDNVLGGQKASVITNKSLNEFYYIADRLAFLGVFV